MQYKSRSSISLHLLLWSEEIYLKESHDEFHFDQLTCNKWNIGPRLHPIKFSLTHKVEQGSITIAKNQ